MDNEYKLNNFAALEPETKNKDAKIEKEREQIKRAISECTTKIMNTTSFRKLAGKTQVILSLSGPDVRTRLTHTIEVAKIAKDICIRLGLNADLAETIALAHDIGHTPFGHVGERTLREIMCGCDTLGNKVRPDDFKNSGFKHNLQSFRVLKDITKVHINKNGSINCEDKTKDVWPYIFWGAPAHTKMTYAKPDTGMDDEILISSKHCDWVYVCNYDKKKECKRNIQEKKKKEIETKKEICKPWYCAKLRIMKFPHQVTDTSRLLKTESISDYLKSEPIEEQYWGNIFCFHKCYLAKLWQNKIDKNDNMIEEYPYLFDHPFPNISYADSIYNYFKDEEHYISLEALVVNQADEIAQRQQDLEDGISKGLLPFDTARNEDVKRLVAAFNSDENVDYGKVSKDTKTSEDLGKFLADFYINVLVNQTKENVQVFAKKTSKPEKINIYSLMNILYTINGETHVKTKWILKEFKENKNITNDQKTYEVKCLKGVFETYNNSAYLYLMSYDHLERFAKRFDSGKQEKLQKLNSMVKLLSACVNSLTLVGNKTDTLCKLKMELKSLETDYKNHKKDDCIYVKVIYRFLIALNSLRKCLSEYFDKESFEYFKKKNKKYWKNIGNLNLNTFYVLNKISKKHFKKGSAPISFSELQAFSDSDLNDYTTDKEGEVFKIWETTLKGKANMVLSELVAFTDKRSTDPDKLKNEDKKLDALDKFKSIQQNTILKSEPVEKNDGKANYILKRLFKAYISNSHQLPDSGLKYILSSLIDDEIITKLLKREESSFKEILKKLKKTLVDCDQDSKIESIYKSKPFEDLAELDIKIDEPTELCIEQIEEIKEIKEKARTKFSELSKGTSNEITAALKNRRKLYNYLIELKKQASCLRNSCKLFSDDENDKKEIKKKLRKLRAILDNPILNAVPYWQSILTRGICDHIASLTDQEAVNEYEKLYAGIMELV